MKVLKHCVDAKRDEFCKPCEYRDTHEGSSKKACFYTMCAIIRKDRLKRENGSLNQKIVEEHQRLLKEL